MKKIRVAAVASRSAIGRPEENAARAAAWARRAADRGAEMVLFPELSVSGYCLTEKRAWRISEPVPGPSTRRMEKAARETGAVLACGLLERDRGLVYNTHALVGAGGYIGKQRKIHLAGGNEYNSWQGGLEVRAFDLGKVRAGVAICYDALFSEMVRTLFFEGAELLLMPFAYPTIARSRFPEEDPTAIAYRAHCFTNGCYALLCNHAGPRKGVRPGVRGSYPGWAGVVDPMGRVAAFTRGPGTSEAFVVTDLDPKILEGRRSSRYFIPRRLRPEIYRTAAGPHPPARPGDDPRPPPPPPAGAGRSGSSRSRTRSS